MRNRLIAASAAPFLSVLALAGCGGATTSDPAANATKITLKSPAIHGRTMPALYTCSGRNTPPPLEWGAVPAATGSLVLFVTGITPKGKGDGYTISIAWAVAGIDPSLHRLEAPHLPRGAVVGVASNGRRAYSVCPPPGHTVQYQFELYGLPHNAAVARQFAGLPILDALETHNSSSPTNAYGAFVVTYKRP